MKFTAALAIVLALAAIALIGLTFSNLLSGYLDTRSCQTECVQGYYYAAAALGAISALLGIITLVGARFKTWSWLVFLGSSFPFAVTAGIFTIGTLGNLPH